VAVKVPEAPETDLKEGKQKQVVPVEKEDGAEKKAKDGKEDEEE
jgi:hypothetical protein